jgi:hypothetical protein
MNLAIHGSRPDPTLDFLVTDAATGAPMRVTILTGVVAFAVDHGRIRVVKGANPATPTGFYVPGMQPLPPGPDPVVVAELSISQLGVYDGETKTSRMHGVAELQAQVVADPQQGGQRFIYLSFNYVSGDPMVLRYRVTVYRPQ